jgi:hypothetical protein
LKKNERRREKEGERERERERERGREREIVRERKYVCMFVVLRECMSASVRVCVCVFV